MLANHRIFYQNAGSVKKSSSIFMVGLIGLSSQQRGKLKPNHLPNSEFFYEWDLGKFYFKIETGQLEI